MKVFYIVLVLALLLWKAYYAIQRGLSTYTQDRRDHDSLREYLLGNGATEQESLRPFLRHALQRTFLPLLSLWRLLLLLAFIGMLMGWLNDEQTVIGMLGWLIMLLAAVLVALLSVVLGYAWWKK